MRKRTINFAILFFVIFGSANFVAASGDVPSSSPVWNFAAPDKDAALWFQETQKKLVAEWDKEPNRYKQASWVACTFFVQKVGDVSDLFVWNAGDGSSHHEEALNRIRISAPFTVPPKSLSGKRVEILFKHYPKLEVAYDEFDSSNYKPEDVDKAFQDRKASFH